MPIEHHLPKIKHKGKYTHFQKYKFSHFIIKIKVLICNFDNSCLNQLLYRVLISFVSELIVLNLFFELLIHLEVRNRYWLYLFPSVLDDADKVSDRVNLFLTRLQFLDQSLVRRFFGRSATHYK